MTMVSAPAPFPRSMDAELYPTLASKLHYMLEQGAITTYKKDRSIADELALESVSPSRRRCLGKLWWVCLRARDHRIRGEKSSFRKWGKLTLLLIGQFPCWWLEKGAYRPWGEVPVGSFRRRIDFSYLPVVGAQAISLFEILCIIET